MTFLETNSVISKVIFKDEKRFKKFFLEIIIGHHHTEFLQSFSSDVSHKDVLPVLLP